MHWQPAERRNEANCRRRMRPAHGRCVRRCGDGGYDDLARHGTARGLRVLPPRRAPRFNGACPNSPAAAWRNYAARDLPFPDRATLAFLTGLIVADTESMCGGAAVSLEPSSDVVRISRLALNQ